MQKRLNVKIKNRESFRPFAPMVLADCVSEWFEWPKSVPTPYMLFTSNVLNKHRRGVDNTFPESGLLTEWVARTRSLIPAVTHVDFSARIQTVDCDNPAYNVLKKFYEKTNVPVLINTSFNVRGEPIVESPLDAIDCFLQTDMDALCIGNYLVEKKQVDNKILDFAKSERKVWALD
jgi:carbamoyltransferase